MCVRVCAPQEIDHASLLLSGADLAVPVPCAKFLDALQAYVAIDTWCKLLGEMENAMN